MNLERIDEIAYQAGCHRHSYHNPSHPDLNGYIINHSVLDRFAELIVRECAKFIEDNSGYDPSNNAWHPEPEDLLKHFGIKE
jgi:hypothetical protein